MGDRANVVIKDTQGGQVVLYTHWDGSELPDILRKALARRQRWNDEQYLARIIFSEMIKDDITGETGYGIGSYVCDGEVIEVDVKAQTVSLKGKPAKSFEDFVA